MYDEEDYGFDNTYFKQPIKAKYIAFSITEVFFLSLFVDVFKNMTLTSPVLIK